MRPTVLDTARWRASFEAQLRAERGSYPPQLVAFVQFNTVGRRLWLSLFVLSP